jgi:hypothetical protein
MRHKEIKKIRTRIYKKRTIVIIEFDNKDFVFIEPIKITNKVKLDVNELELLIGSRMRFVFYEKGEMLFNGNICKKNNILIKDFFIELEKPIEILKVKNKDKLLPFKKIKDIFYFFKFGKENVGIKTEDEKVVFLSLDTFTNHSKIEKSEQHILIGSFIMPEYYKKGERMLKGQIAQFNNAFKALNLRYSASINKMHENFENESLYLEKGSLNENSAEDYGYSDWDDLTLEVAFEGNAEYYWNID